MSYKIIILFISVFLMIPSVYSQKENKHIREGNKLYKDEKFEDSQISYLRALEENASSFSGAFNLGNSFYKQQKWDEAINQFKNLSQIAPDKETKAKAYHNLGNSYMKSEKLKESIDAYKQALRNNPSDEDTRHNLAYAMQLLKQQEEQEQDQDKNDDKKDDKKEDDKKQDQKKDEKKDEKQDQQQQQPQKDQMTKEEAQRMLEAMEREEKKLQEKLQKKQAVKIQIEKDW
jgi:Ca-activated chloride channel homolog